MARMLLNDRQQSVTKLPSTHSKGEQVKSIKRASLAAALLAVPLAAIPTIAAAQAKAEPDYTFSGNAGVFSDYRFRGFTQTDFKPAFQGGFDFESKAGFYLGNWNSNVSSVLYNGASLEMDFYGGYKGEAGGLGYDIGAIYYAYPGTGKYDPDFKAKNVEGYVGVSFGPFSAKYSHAFTDFFGVKAPGISTKGSQYLEVGAGFELADGWSLAAHAGWQKVKNLKQLGASDDSYVDYKLGVSKDLDGWALGAEIVATSKKEFFTTSDGKDGGKTALVLSVSKSF
jgi:uncharacterized protein (TIGR02001 family)